jgi:hypothetical protein
VQLTCRPEQPPGSTGADQGFRLEVTEELFQNMDGHGERTAVLVVVVVETGTVDRSFLVRFSTRTAAGMILSPGLNSLR